MYKCSCNFTAVPAVYCIQEILFILLPEDGKNLLFEPLKVMV